MPSPEGSEGEHQEANSTYQCIKYIHSTLSSCLTPPQSRERVLLSVFYQQGGCILFSRAHPKALAVPALSADTVRWAAPAHDTVCGCWDNTFPGAGISFF